MRRYIRAKITYIICIVGMNSKGNKMRAEFLALALALALTLALTLALLPLPSRPRPHPPSPPPSHLPSPSPSYAHPRRRLRPRPLSRACDTVQEMTVCPMIRAWSIVVVG